MRVRWLGGARLPSCSAAPPRRARQPSTDFAALERARIAELELARDTRGDVLVSRARLHADPSVRARALLALARVQDLRTGPTVAEALGDASAPVRAVAAFAAGRARARLGARAGRDPRRSWAGRSSRPRRRRPTALRAWRRWTRSGASGPPRRLRGWCSCSPFRPASASRRTTRARRSPVRAAIALGVAARAAAPVPESARPGLERLATALLPAYRWAGVYALAQLKTPPSRPVLLAALRDDDPEVRAIGDQGVSRRSSSPRTRRR